MSSDFFKTYYRPLLCLILFFAFLTRIVWLDKPERYIFDEVYHAATAKLIAVNDQRSYEWWHPAPEPNAAIDWLHPPLAKYTQAASINIFGANSFGWRFSSVVFGVGVVWVISQLALALFEDKRTSLMAAALASLDGLLLVQSRIAMNDIHVTFWILVAAWAYVKFYKLKEKKWLFYSSLATGLAMGTKWSGLFIGIGLLSWESVRILQLFWAQKNKAWLELVWNAARALAAFIVIPGLIYVLSYSHMFLQGKSFICFSQTKSSSCPHFSELKWQDQVVFKGYVSDFIELHHQIWWYQNNLKATHTYQSRPWQWFLDLRPVWYHVDYGENNSTTITNIYAQGNPALFWLGDIALVLTLFTLGYAHFTKRQNFSKNWPMWFVISLYFLLWFPWQFSPRIMFFYHYTPAVPWLCLILARTLTQWDKKESGVMWGSLALIAIVFAVWFPNWTGIAVDRDFANKVYFSIKSWK